MHQVNLWSPTGPDRKLIRENKYEKAVLLAGGGAAWSWLRLMGMHQVNLWFRWGRRET